ncbi:MAG TPA: metallophosphoesterase, partial [Longimicrobiales bacterium]|nr:metallophosphoesterase [Longimicrobiales bacterium]
MTKILHISDLQCGKPYVPRAGEALVRFAHAARPDVVVVAGDLTQRAKAREFRAAAELLGRLPDVPTVITLGNHDVPLYRVWERVLTPYRNWHALALAPLDATTAVPGATFVVLSSSAPRSAIVGGRLLRRQVEFARTAFASAPPSDARVLVVHHHFVHTRDRSAGRTLPGARKLLARFEEMGVDLLLGGHVHQTHITTSRALLPGEGPGIPLVACGTTTSRRGRGPEAG